MSHNFSRRRLLASSATLAAVGVLGLAPVPARAEAQARLRAVRRSLEVNGKAASVFGLIGPDGKSGLTLDPGRRFQVALANELDEALIVHWHGQTPSPDQDGVIDTDELANPSTLFDVDCTSTGAKVDLAVNGTFAGLGAKVGHIGLDDTNTCDGLSAPDVELGDLAQWTAAHLNHP